MRLTKLKSVSRYCTMKSRVSVVPTWLSTVISPDALMSVLTRSPMAVWLKMRELEARVMNQAPGLSVSR